MTRAPQGRAARGEPRGHGSDGPRRSPCPVAATLDLIGDRWTLLVIRDMLAGRSRFRDLANSPERIATNILASRLASLQAAGLVVASACAQRAGTMEYALTPQGRTLVPLILAMRDWGLEHVAGTRALVKAGGAAPRAET